MMQKQQDSTKKAARLVLNKETVRNLKVKTAIQAGLYAVAISKSGTGGCP